MSEPVSKALESETAPEIPAQTSESVPVDGRPHDGPSGNGRVQVAYLHQHSVSHSWHQAFMGLAAYDAANDGYLSPDPDAGPNQYNGPIAVSCSGPNGLVEGRNMVAKTFLDHTPHEWLWFIDTDMGFRPDVLSRLVGAADPQHRPVVGGLCFALKETGLDGFGGRRYTPLPTIFGLMRHPKGHIGFVNRHIYPRDTVVQAAGTGAACLLIHRSALETVRKKYGDTWFDLVAYGDGQPISEDLSFCWRLGASGIPLFIHTGVRTTHHKQIYVGEEDYQMPSVEPVYRSTMPGGAS